MKIFNLFKLLSFSFVAFTHCLTAETLLDSQNFNVTLNLSQSHYLTTTDLEFRIIPHFQINDEAFPIESTTGKVVAYSNSQCGHFALIIPSDSRYVSDDGYSFLMRSSCDENPGSIPFILKSSYNADGTPAENGVRYIYPGDVIMDVDGSFKNHKVTMDLWGSLLYNGDINEVLPDFYRAVLKVNHFSND